MSLSPLLLRDIDLWERTAPIRQPGPRVDRARAFCAAEGRLRRLAVRLWVAETAARGVVVAIDDAGRVLLSPRHRVTDQIRQHASRGGEWREALLAVLRETR